MGPLAQSPRRWQEGMSATSHPQLHPVSPGLVSWGQSSEERKGTEDRPIPALPTNTSDQEADSSSNPCLLWRAPLSIHGASSFPFAYPVFHLLHPSTRPHQLQLSQSPLLQEAFTISLWTSRTFHVHSTSAPTTDMHQLSIAVQHFTSLRTSIDYLMLFPNFRKPAGA